MSLVRQVSDEARGWLFPEEGPALHRVALTVPGPYVEVGSYAGKSTVWLAYAAQDRRTHVVAVDHHRGSPEMQRGQENHDVAVEDPLTGDHDTLAHFRRTVRAAGLEDAVVTIVAPSLVVAAYWRHPVGLVFIDADHSYRGTKADYEAWAPHIVEGGVLAFHDTTIPDIARVTEEATAEGFVLEEEVRTLRILRRTG